MNKKEMESELGFLVSVLIICADITATVLGIEAEIAQSKQQPHHAHQQHSRHITGCGRKPSSGAFAEGVAAMVLLSIVHVTANVLGGCTYIRSKQDFTRATANKILAVALLVLSWMFFAVSYSTLMLATLANSRSNRFCSLPHRWFFLVGGIFCFGHGLVTSGYYVSAIAAKKEDKENVQPANTSRA
ncbi:protein DESIGUAL 3 isoform X1 [Raphanus sativus]|uniref:Protein DESIGUAL 3 isoform X1 n=1 Tax=Raphanus sativus TaxID=3726 RepID=A0A6J0LZM4_RAPSA|nr:protein DESIGUAL 3 isoform X1 [Raphanus sativus]